MRIRILRVEKVLGHVIYIRNFENVFEYLLIFDGEIYSAHIVIKKTFYQRIMRIDYSKDQKEKIVRILINMAKSTIETIKENKSLQGAPNC